MLCSKARQIDSAALKLIVFTWSAYAEAWYESQFYGLYDNDITPEAHFHFD